MAVQPATRPAAERSENPAVASSSQACTESLSSGGPPHHFHGSAQRPAPGNAVMAADGICHPVIGKLSRKQRTMERVGAHWAEQRRAQLNAAMEEVNQRLHKGSNPRRECPVNVSTLPPLDWLPACGSAWQDGRKKSSASSNDSIKSFATKRDMLERAMEAMFQTPSSKCPQGSDALPKLAIQPYVGKRVRGATNNS